MTPETVSRPRVTFEDPDLPHQIVLTLRGGGHGIMVSCNCLRAAGPVKGKAGRSSTHEPLEVRTRWEAAEALAVWRAHLAEAGAT
jgi:hypothetical protein